MSANSTATAPRSPPPPPRNLFMAPSFADSRAVLRRPLAPLSLGERAADEAALVLDVAELAFRVAEHAGDREPEARRGHHEGERDQHQQEAVLRGYRTVLAGEPGAKVGRARLDDRKHPSPPSRWSVAAASWLAVRYVRYWPARLLGGSDFPRRRDTRF